MIYDTTIPEGVTIRQPGEPKPARPRNKIEQAALLADREQSIALIAGALGVEPTSDLAQLYIPDNKRWSRIDPSSRLMDIGNWLKAEAFECMDLVDIGPVSTIGD